MKTKITIFVFFFLSLFLLPISKTYADSAESSAELATTIASSDAQVASNAAQLEQLTKKDHRVSILQKFLEKWNSPLAQYSQDFILQADKYNLPWNLVAAIAGTESTFGQEVPENCNNAFGFGIYTNHMTCFTSYPEAIKTVSKSLREDYIDKWHLNSVNDIGRTYAASETWSGHTQYFIDQMEVFRQQYEIQLVPTLPISL